MYDDKQDRISLYLNIDPNPLNFISYNKSY